MNCTTVDELAAAYALGGVDADEERTLSAHLETCDQPHAEARELIGVGAVLVAAAEPVRPSPQLRDRLLATVAATPQDHRPVLDRSPAREPIFATPTSIPWWRRVASPMALAAVALAAAIGLGVWNVGLGQQVAQRDQALRAIAGADAVHQVAGSAGSGLLLDDGGTAIFVAEDLADLPSGSLYELWLIGSDGVPVAVGTVTDAAGVALVTLERGIGEATTFAVTVETERVSAPTTDPVLVASLEG
jgi:anti-sigma-K factor RskA